MPWTWSILCTVRQDMSKRKRKKVENHQYVRICFKELKLCSCHLHSVFSGCLFSPLFLCRSCSPLQTFSNVLTHFVLSLCILVNISMDVKLLYNQPSEIYPFKVIHLVDSYLYHTEQRGWARLIGTFSFVSVYPYLYYKPSKPLCMSLPPPLLDPGGPECVSLGPETWNLHSLINIQAFTDGCNSQLGLPLLLEPQRRTTLTGIGAPFFLFTVNFMKKGAIGIDWVTF